MKIAFYTLITNDFKYGKIDYNSFINSFKYFHPDIDLIVFEDDIIKKTFQENSWLTYENCKPTFAKLLYNDYDLLVNIDSDFYFFDRCVEILESDYDIAACANYNIECNTSIKKQNINNFDIQEVTELNYIQGAMIASTKKEFWDEYEYLNKELAHKLPTKENDVLNIMWYSGKYKTKILDGDVDFKSSNFKQYYNCTSLGREKEAIIKNNKVYLDNKVMRSYHCGGGPWRKPRINELFSKEVSDWFYKKINYKEV